MAQRRETLFDLYDFAEDEAIVASSFTETQRCYLQTLRAETATKKLNMETTPGNDELYLRSQEYYRGRLEVLSELINTSDDNVHELEQVLHSKQATQGES